MSLANLIWLIHFSDQGMKGFPKFWSWSELRSRSLNSMLELEMSGSEVAPMYPSRMFQQKVLFWEIRSWRILWRISVPAMTKYMWLSWAWLLASGRKSTMPCSSTLYSILDYCPIASRSPFESLKANQNLVTVSRMMRLLAATTWGSIFSCAGKEFSHRSTVCRGGSFHIGLRRSGMTACSSSSETN